MYAQKLLHHCSFLLHSVPYYGCWGGLWKVPYPEFLGLTYEEFHTYWTGVAEISGGLFLIASGIGIIDVSPTVPAALLGSLVRGLRLLILGLHMHLPISNISCCSCIRWLQLPLQIFLCLLMMLRWVRVYLVSMVLTTFIFFVSMVILISEYI